MEQEGTEKKPAGSGMEDFIKFVKSKKPITATSLENAEKIYLHDGMMKIEFSSSSIHSDRLSRPEGQENLRNLLKEFFDQDLKVKIEVKAPLEANSSPLKEQIANNREEVHRDPIVKDALEIFGGKVVKTKPKEKE
jgi:hypothetical protein